MATANHRRVIVGHNERGRSVVTDETDDLTVIEPTVGVTLHEVWRQDGIPATAEEAANPSSAGVLEAPPHGAVIRILTVEPFGGNLGSWTPHLHSDDSLHVITMTQGELDIVLEDGDVQLGPGDSIVLPGSMHDLRNLSGSPASFVYTSFPLER